MLLNLLLSLLALGTASIGAYIDLREGQIPNKLTFSILATGIVAHGVYGAYRGSLYTGAFGLVGACVGFTLGYPLYRFGGFGAGDVKLMAAIGALLPVAPASMAVVAAPAFTNVPLFPLTVLIDGLLVSSPVIVGYALLCLIRGESILAKEVPVSQLRSGMIPSEAVWETDDGIERGSSLPENCTQCYADPFDTEGLKDRQIEELTRLHEKNEFDGPLRVKRTFPFAPVPAAGTLTAVLFGNLYWTFLLHL